MYLHELEEHLRNGGKIVHKEWKSVRYLYKDNYILYFRDENDDFCYLNYEEIFDDVWEIYEEPKKQERNCSNCEGNCRDPEEPNEPDEDYVILFACTECGAVRQYIDVPCPGCIIYDPTKVHTFKVKGDVIG